MKRTYWTHLLLTALLLAACAADTPAAESGTAGSVPETGTVETEATPSFVSDDLPADLDFGGETVHILIGDYNNAYVDDMYSAEESGNRLSTAIYNMIGSVSERLNAVLAYRAEYYNWDSMTRFQTQITQGILAGDGAVDLLFDAQNFSAQMRDGEYFADLSELDYVNPEKPWYNQDVRNNLANDYVHFASGQFALANVKNVFALYFNADLYAALDIEEDLYAAVDAGKWTRDMLETLTKDVYSDLNGNAKADVGDRFAVTFGDQNKYLGFIKAFGLDMFRKTDDGYTYTYGNERALEAAEYCQRLIYENRGVLKAAQNFEESDESVSSGGGNYASKVFVDGNALFSFGLVADAAVIVPMIDFGYGILPYPKWDENQENYTNMLQRNCYALIPTSAADPNRAGAVLEALASESYRALVPEYCEVSLKTRYSQDNDVSRMFDIIINHIVYDPGEIYASLLGTPSALFKNHLVSGSTNWASTAASNEKKLSKLMESILS